jgi:hypothetical protein
MKQKHTLSEIESYVRKAAQATGLGWGLAEEAGKAARWLAAFNLPGVEVTLANLQQLSGKDYSEFKPTHLDDVWRAHGDYLCPIITGAALADRSSQMLTGTEFRLGPVAYPILLAAMIGQAARYHHTTFTTSWGGVSISCYENGIRIEGNSDDLSMTGSESVKCVQSGDTNPQSLPSTLACDIDSDAWAAIDRLAFKTYAPATEESRAGAGAGLTDND